MKKYLSVFSLTARESMVKLAVVWILSAVWQGAVFYMNMMSARVQESKILSYAFGNYNDEISISYIFSFSLLITGIFLVKTGMEFRTKTGYTLRRLRISEKQVFVLQSAYNCFMIFMLFVFETVLCFFLLKWGETLIEQEFVTNQTTYLTFYTTSFLREVFGGRNVITIIRNIIIFASLGFNLAAFSYLWRRGSKYLFGLLVLAAAVFLFWMTPDFSYPENLTVTAVAVGSLLIALGIVKTRRKEYDT